MRSHEAGRHFVLNIIKYGKYHLGDEAGGCFSFLLVKSS